jgi:hypothetical protein
VAANPGDPGFTYDTRSNKMLVGADLLWWFACVDAVQGVRKRKRTGFI